MIPFLTRLSADYCRNSVVIFSGHKAILKASSGVSCSSLKTVQIKASEPVRACSNTCRHCIDHSWAYFFMICWKMEVGMMVMVTLLALLSNRSRISLSFSPITFCPLTSSKLCSVSMPANARTPWLLVNTTRHESDWGEKTMIFNLFAWRTDRSRNAIFGWSTLTRVVNSATVF